MKLANMRVGVRIGAGFATMLALMALLAALGINRMGQVQDRLNDIVDGNNVQTNLAAAMRVSVNDRMIALRNIALLSEAAEMQPEVERIRAQEQLYAASRDKLAAMFSSLADTTAGEKALMDSISTEEKAIQPLIAKAIQFGLANRSQEATAVLLKEVRPLQRKWVAALSDMIALQTRLSEVASAEAQQAYASARLQMIGLSLVAICFGSVMGWLLTRSITGPLNAAVKIARTVADGDLSARIEVRTTDETGQLLRALRDMNDNLARIVGQVRSGTETIATASGEIAAGNLDLSSRTERQASSLEETASSMEELTSTVRQNADNARQANGLAQSASDVALRGGSVVAQVIETMGSINGSARKIVDIVALIDGIAFQTNILALNAAVEAARAGEQGRGFAVVASEVRNLAQRSAAAAKEIKGLIDDSLEQVDAGGKLVDQAGTTMREIVDSVGRVTAIMSDISAASREQSAGIGQVNQAIAEMDTVTQQNASVVEQAAAAAASLQEQSGQLLQLVSVFKVGDAADRTPATPAQRHAPVRAVPALPAATAKPQRAVTEAARLGNVRESKPVAGTRRANGADWVEF